MLQRCRRWRIQGTVVQQQFAKESIVALWNPAIVSPVQMVTRVNSRYRKYAQAVLLVEQRGICLSYVGLV